MSPAKTPTQWQYLEQRPHSWRRQLYIKGKRLRPFTVWIAMQVEQMTPEETAVDWDLPLAAVTEVIAYCEANRELLEQEAEEERRYLKEKRISLEPKVARR